jgi:hypothetical protein
VRTVLLVSGNEGLRSRLAHALGARSVFFASSDEEEALNPLRVTQVKALVKGRQKKLSPPTPRRLYSAHESEASRRKR